jgi:hypothetical protein
MYGLYTPIILLQAFCVYHAYKNNAEQRWYWFIILFPLFGCGFYLFDHFYNRQSINAITENVKGVLNTNYKIERLEKEVRFNDSIKNRLNLAEAYLEVGRYQDAQRIYEECLTGFMSDDPDLKMKLLHTCYLTQDFSQAVELGKSLASEKRFRDSEARLAYAWSLHYLHQTDEAEQVFKDLDRPFTNYVHRLEYSKLLQSQGRKDELKNKLRDLLDEFEHMRSNEKRFHRDIIRQTRDLQASMEKT